MRWCISITAIERRPEANTPGKPGVFDLATTAPAMSTQRTPTSSALRLARTLKCVRRLGVALLLVLGFSVAPVFAQTPTVQVRFADLKALVDQKAPALASEARFKGLSPHERNAGIEFLIGNMLFVAAHEMGHAVISELDLPVLGREEDAADAFATIGALKVVANDFSHSVLQEAAKGWFWSARRDRKDGEKPTYYGEHGLNEQRAYQIVCLMVGSDPVKFKALADETKLPDDRRRSCTWDFDTASRSWELSSIAITDGRGKTSMRRQKP